MSRRQGKQGVPYGAVWSDVESARLVVGVDAHPVLPSSGVTVGS